MGEILRLHRIPKVQVERIVGPILGIFLPDVLGPLLEDAQGGVGFEVISPEFPLKRSDNNQSTNIDWLVLHRRLGLVVLFELKTASDSIDRAQLETYELVRQRIEREGGAFLMDDARQIRNASPQRAKYDALIDSCVAYEEALRGARRAATVCRVPADCSVPDTGAPVVVRHFRDLPTSISGELRDEWAVVREALSALDDGTLRSAARTPGFIARPQEGAVQSASAAEFAVHVLANLRRARDARTPARFWIGKTGSGATPNYQVEFSDGSIQTFRYSGASFGATSFNPSKLRGPFEFIAK